MDTFSGQAPVRVRAARADLTGPEVLQAVRCLRSVPLAAVSAAREWASPGSRSSTDETAQRYGTTGPLLRAAAIAIARLHYHGLDPMDLAHYRDPRVPDGTVLIGFAAGLSRGEIADLVQGVRTPDPAALGMLAGLRGYRLPDPAAQGTAPATA